MLAVFLFALFPSKNLEKSYFDTLRPGTLAILTPASLILQSSTVGRNSFPPFSLKRRTDCAMSRRSKPIDRRRFESPLDGPFLLL